MHDIMRGLDHQQWARDSCAAALIPDDDCTELNVALDMVIMVTAAAAAVVVVVMVMMTMMFLLMSLNMLFKVVNTTVIAKDIETLISVLSDMNRATGATASVSTRTVNEGKQTIATVMPFSSADKLGPFKDWKAEVCFTRCVSCGG
jgi:hypothetical protein